MFKFGRIMDRLIFGGLLLVPFVPLLVFDALAFPFITSKAFVFYILIEILLAFYLIRILLPGEKHYPLPSVISFAYLTFVCIAGLANVFGADALASMFGSLERTDGFYSLLHLFAFFILLTAYFRKESNRQLLIIVSASVSSIIGVFAITQWITADSISIDTRVDVFLGNPVFLGTYALLHVWITGLLLIRREQSFPLIIVWIILLLNISTVVLTGTRGALLALLGGAGISFFIYLIKTPLFSPKQKILGACVVGSMIIIGVIGIVHYRQQFEEVPMLGRLLLLSPETITEQPRYFMWKAALLGVREHPLLGWGQENFGQVYQKHYDPQARDRKNVARGEFWSDRVHNMYLEWLVSAGIIGFLGYVFFFSSIFHAAWNGYASSLSEQSLMIGLLSAYALNNLFAFDVLTNSIVFTIILGHLHHRSSAYTVHIPNSLNFFKKILLAIILLGTLAAFFITAEGIKIAHNLAVVLTEKEISNIDMVLIEDLLKPRGYVPNDIAVNVAYTIASLLDKGTAGETYNKESINVLDAFYTDRIFQSSLDAKEHYFFSGLYYLTGNQKMALAAISRSIELSPKNQLFIVHESNILRKQGDYSQARERSEQAYLLEPDYNPSLEAYAISLIYEGRIAEAEALLTERYGTYMISGKDIISAYVAQNQLGRALALVEMNIEKDPVNASFHISRIALYLKLENKSQALEATKDFMEAHESHEKIGKNIIQKIQNGEQFFDLKFNAALPEV